jgi:hypothetical protein
MVRSGHDVLVTAAASLGRHVTDLELAFTPSGPDLVPIRSELIMYSLEEERQAIPGHFIARLGPARARDLITIARDWAADLMISDDADYGAVVAAEAVGVPHVSVVVSAAGGLATPELIAGPLEALRAAVDLPVESGLLMLRRSLTLNQFPPTFRSPAAPLVGSVVNYRSGPVPPQPPAADGGKAYVTLGTIFNTESGDLLAKLTSAVAASPQVSSVIVATGEHIDPSELGPQPDTVMVHRFVHQQQILVSCSVVVCHGGSGSVLDAIRFGLPIDPASARRGPTTQRSSLPRSGLCCGLARRPGDRRRDRGCGRQGADRGVVSRCCPKAAGRAASPAEHRRHRSRVGATELAPQLSPPGSRKSRVTAAKSGEVPRL